MPALVVPGPTAAVVIRLRADVAIEIVDATPSVIAAIVAELARSLP